LSLFDDPSTVTCPQCGTAEPIEIVYGFPSSEMMEASAIGLISLGGCIVDESSPRFRCRADECRREFGEL